MSKFAAIYETIAEGGGGHDTHAEVFDTIGYATTAISADWPTTCCGAKIYVAKVVAEYDSVEAFDADKANLIEKQG